MASCIFSHRGRYAGTIEQESLLILVLISSRFIFRSRSWISSAVFLTNRGPHPRLDYNRRGITGRSRPGERLDQQLNRSILISLFMSSLASQSAFRLLTSSSSLDRSSLNFLTSSDSSRSFRQFVQALSRAANRPQCWSGSGSLKLFKFTGN